MTDDNGPSCHPATIPLALVLFLMILFILGCGTSTRSTGQTDTVLHETLTINGTIKVPFATAAGSSLYDLPLSLRIQRNSSQIAKSDAAAQTKIEAPEIGALIATAIRQAFPAAGAFMGPAVAAKDDWTSEIATGGGALVLIIAKALADAKAAKEKDRQIEYHKNDAKEGWDKATASKPKV